MPEDVQNSFTEITETGWLGNIKKSISALAFGVVIFLAAFPLIFWNEGRAIHTEQSLDEGEKMVVSTDASTVNPNNQGRLIHVIGKADTDDRLTDEAFAIVTPALKLQRRAEMYQWVESKESHTQKKLGGGRKTVTEYSYSQEWSSNLKDSSRFKQPENHHNPASMPFQEKTVMAKNVKLGAFDLSQELLTKINRSEPQSYSLPETLPAQLQPYKDKLHIEGEELLIGADPMTPEVGDMRISFSVVKPQVVSVVAQQMGQTFTPFMTHNSQTIELLETGPHSAKEMFKIAKDNNNFFTWFLRIIFFIMMFLGLRSLFAPLEALASVLPFLGDVLGFGGGIIAFLLALPIYLSTTAFAWFSFRPGLTMTLLAIAGVALGGAITYFIKQKSQIASPLAPQKPVFGEIQLK